MPRQTPRLPGPDEWTAQRVKRLREEHNWSAGQLARLVTEAGCPMAQSSVWDIENRKPPRRISVSEAVALAEVFGIGLEELVADPAGESEHQLRRWWTTLRENIHDLESNRDYLRSMAADFGISADLVEQVSRAADEAIAALERASDVIVSHLGKVV